jgi:hypothetical protein
MAKVNQSNRINSIVMFYFRLLMQLKKTTPILLIGLVKNLPT